jgi:hypothetical protein
MLERRRFKLRNRSKVEDLSSTRLLDTPNFEQFFGPFGKFLRILKGISRLTLFVIVISLVYYFITRERSLRDFIIDQPPHDRVHCSRISDMSIHLLKSTVDNRC